MDNTKEKIRRFKDEKERLKAANRVMYIITIILNIAFLPGTLLVVLGGTINFGIVFVTIVILCSIILSTVFYFKDKTNKMLKYLFVITYYISYFEIVISHDIAYVCVYFLALVVGSILYLNRKFTVTLGVMAVGASALKVVYNLIKAGGLDEEVLNNTTTQLWAMLAVTWAILVTIKYVIRFIDDMLLAVQDEREVQQRMVGEILETASVVRKGAVSLTDIVHDVGDSAHVVNNSMEEISSDTSSATEAIQEQNLMTQSIQTAIANARTQSQNTVQTALNTEQTIEKSMAVIDELRDHSFEIAKTNGEVVESMERLQSKTEEVKGIAGIIIDISRQTNLLSLNAAIESARAGELGKGFAVVSEEIRKLSEETRLSTENITKIVEELSHNALLATEIVKGSIEAASRQGNLIEETAKSYHMIDQDVKTVVNNVNDIDNMINGLYESNNKLVASVNLLSTNSEQINANSRKAATLSGENLAHVQEANSVLGEVMEAVERFEKYSV